MDDFNREQLTELILKYKMNEMEIKSLKISFLWSKIVFKAFPGHNIVRLRKKGDPRKSILFKHCYKLAMQTKGLIPDDEYHLYIIAQINFYKKFLNAEHARIDPNFLHGEQAWKRWRVWKDLFDKSRKIDHQDKIEAQVKVNPILLSAELSRTKEFLQSVFDRLPNLQDITDCIQNRKIVGWVTNGKVSPYYVLLSPLVRQISGDFDVMFNFDLNVYKSNIDSRIEELFRKMFEYEFQ